MPAWPLALATLPAGFAVAEATGARPAGGIVLLALGLATVYTARAGIARSAAWGFIAFGSFAASHALADVLGAWGGVAVAAGVTGAAGYALLDHSWVQRRHLARNSAASS